MTEAKMDVFVEYPKGEDGEENKFVAFVTGAKPLAEPGQPGEQGGALLNSLASTDGVEGGKLMGRYTISVQIARTFDPEEVLEDVCALIRRHSSAIITPQEGIVTP